jgi:hypothetical protein
MIVVGSLRQGREISRLLDAQIRQLLAEIVERRRGDAVGVHAEVDLVEIKLEDLLFLEGPLHADGKDGLLQLAIELALAVEQEVLRHLLGYGGGALGAPAGVGHHLDERAADAHEVEATVLVEAPVLGGQERLDHLFGDHVDRHEDAPLAGVLGHQGAVGGVDARHHRRLVLGQPLVVRQVARGHPDVEAGDGDATQEQQHAGGENEGQEAQQPAAPPALSRLGRRENLDRSHRVEIPSLPALPSRGYEPLQARWGNIGTLALNVAGSRPPRPVADQAGAWAGGA